MRTGGGLLLVIVGLFVLWIVVTGRLTNLQAAWGQLQHGPTTDSGTGGTVQPTALPALPALPSFPVAHVA